MKTALITGMEGFTGQFLASKLSSEGYTVHGTIYGGTKNSHYEHSLDLNDRDAVHDLITRIQPDVVVHLAAISFVAHADVAEIYKTNIIGTRYLLEALANVKKVPSAVLLASSAGVYGQATTGTITETTPTNPANDYSVSKLAMEKMAMMWVDKLPITIVRPFNYTGPGQSSMFVLPKIVSHFRRGEKQIELGNLDVSRDFSDVRMVVNSYTKLLKLAPAGEIFNICSGTVYSLGQVLDMMAGIAGYTIQVKINPAYTRKNEIMSLGGSNAKLCQAIGDIKSVPLHDTLGWMYNAGER